MAEGDMDRSGGIGTWEGDIPLGPSVIRYRCDPIDGYAMDARDVEQLRADILSEVRDLLRAGHLRGTVTAFVCVDLLPGSHDDDHRPVTCAWSIVEAVA